MVVVVVASCRHKEEKVWVKVVVVVETDRHREERAWD
jgi:hypothetical protein